MPVRSRPFVDALPTHLGAEYVGGDLVLGADGIGFAAAYLDPSEPFQTSIS